MSNRTVQYHDHGPHSVESTDVEDEFLDARSIRSTETVREWLESGGNRPVSFPSLTGRPSLESTGVRVGATSGRSCMTPRPDTRVRAGGRSNPTVFVVRGGGRTERDDPSDAEGVVRSRPIRSTRAVEGRRTTICI